MLLDTELLKESLYKLVEIEKTTRQEITKQSAVHNIGRMIAGTIEPTPESWWKLHKAYPESIPQPVYRDGTALHNNTQTTTNSPGSIQSGRDTISSTLSTPNITKDDQELIELLLKYGNNKIKSDLRTILNKVRDISI